MLAPPTLDVFIRAVIFELRTSFGITDETARLLVLSHPSVIAVEHAAADPEQAARALVLCAAEEGSVFLSNPRPLIPSPSSAAPPLDLPSAAPAAECWSAPTASYRTESDTTSASVTACR